MQRMWIAAVFVVVGLNVLTSVAAPFEPDTARIEQIAKWLPVRPQGAGWPVTDRDQIE